jgi:hypothetical protein
MNDRNNPAGSNLAATLMLDSVARSHSRHLSRATLTTGPLMFDISGAAAARRDPAAHANRFAGEATAEEVAKSTVEWTRHLAASANRLRGEMRGR